MAIKKVLVVGGAGFIGSHVNKLLNQSGYETVVFDNLSHGSPDMVVAGELVVGDLANPNDIMAVFQKHHFDAVMHFAALIDVRESMQFPALYYRNNVSYTLNLLDAMLAHGVQLFIFSSTAAVYGLPQTELVSEKHPCLPISPYGKSKLMVETILKDFTHAYGMKTCCLRYFNAAGGDPEGVIKLNKFKGTNVIPILLQSILNANGAFRLFGTDYNTPDGTCVRDFIHVNDLASAHIIAMEHLDLSSNPQNLVYNLGNGQGYSLRQLIKCVEKVTGEKVQVTDYGRREGDPPIVLADAKLAGLDLGWKPQYNDLEEIVTHAWQALRGCEKIQI